MKLRLRHSVVILATAAMPLVATLGASAQDINFSCSSGAHLYLDSPANTGTDYCTQSSIPDNDMLNYYSPTGIKVTSTSGYSYNDFQGDASKGGAPVSPPPGVPSLNINTSTDLLTVDLVNSLGAATGGDFQFNSVDLFALTGVVEYTIKGYDGSNPVPEFTETGTATSTLCGTPVKACYTTIAGNSDYVTSLTIQTTDVVSSGGGFGRLDHIEITVPEGGAGLMFLLLAGGACFGAMGFRSRQLAV